MPRACQPAGVVGAVACGKGALDDAAVKHPPDLSIVVPARDEAGNLSRLITEVQQGVRDAGVAAELIVVDDGSTDGTWGVLTRESARHDWVRPVRLAAGAGQTVALGVGIGRAAAPFVATLDADLQNDPADLPAMLRLLESEGVDLVQGYRAERRDGWRKRAAGRVGRAARRLVLRDAVRDTGCSTRVARAALARRWPLHLDGMHRFLPACSVMLGGTVIEVPVNHRPRTVGVSHYGSLRRGAVGLVDLFAVRWMMARHHETPHVHPPEAPHTTDAAPPEAVARSSRSDPRGRITTPTAPPQSAQNARPSLSPP